MEKAFCRFSPESLLSDHDTGIFYLFSVLSPLFMAFLPLFVEISPFVVA